MWTLSSALLSPIPSLLNSGDYVWITVNHISSRSARRVFAQLCPALQKQAELWNQLSSQEMHFDFPQCFFRETGGDLCSGQQEECMEAHLCQKKKTNSITVQKIFHSIIDQHGSYDNIWNFFLSTISSNMIMSWETKLGTSDTLMASCYRAPTHWLSDPFILYMQL